MVFDFILTIWKAKRLDYLQITRLLFFTDICDYFHAEIFNFYKIFLQKYTATAAFELFDLIVYFMAFK